MKNKSRGNPNDLISLGVVRASTMAKQSRLRNQRVSYRCATGEEIVEKANRGSKARHRQEKGQEGIWGGGRCQAKEVWAGRVWAVMVFD
jgi:hypothetical protein